MDELKILEGKHILIVDDEPDVLETLVDLLNMCQTDTAPDFETARDFLNKKTYDMAIFDIMGVKGYDLLELANQRGVPALMFTAHALSPDDFFKSIKGGAKAYIPKEKMSEIATYVAELLKARQEGIQKPVGWFTRLEKYFDRKFGSDWLQRYKKFRPDYDWLFFDDE